MKPAPFDYLRPGSLAEAATALAEEPNAKVLAGGQSLVPLLSMRLAAPSMLVDINGLPDLSGIEVTGDGVRIGALARHADVLASRSISSLIAVKQTMVEPTRAEITAAAAREYAQFAELLGGAANTDALAAFADRRDAPA